MNRGGTMSKKIISVGLTTLGSEHGVDNLLQGATLAKNSLFDIVLIGQGQEGFESYETENEEEAHKIMEDLLDKGEIAACVTMHYNFPIGVSTVGRVVTPSRGKEMLLATTTGTSSTNRVEGMIKNTIYGIATAKSLGIEKPTVGVVDSLTGNLFMKVFSAFNTGGDYEAQGYGYGPGVGEDYDRRILILSRASGAPVVANSLKYAYEIAVGEVNELARKEYGKAKEANLDALLNKLKEKKETSQSEEVKAPEKEIVTAQIAGVDIMDLEDATKELWKRGIYAESGMGCTGPIVLVNTDKKLQAEEVLKEVGLLS